MTLLSVAPLPTTNLHVGVFAVNENVSLLLQPSDYFLPTCIHNTGVATLNMTISKVQNGAIWGQETAIQEQTGRLVPFSPPALQANLTGEYQCTAPASAWMPSTTRYRLDVVGKEKYGH